MMARIFILLFVVVLVASCKYDNKMTLFDDDNLPIDTIENNPCDSIPVPNPVFSNEAGAWLVFADSTETLFDTLVCTSNTASKSWIVTHMVSFCESYYHTHYVANWLSPNDNFEVRFSHTTGAVSSYRAYAQQFSSNSFDHEVDYQDTLAINNSVYYNAHVYYCDSEMPCEIVKAFVIARNEGLVAFRHQDGWWVKN